MSEMKKRKCLKVSLTCGSALWTFYLGKVRVALGRFVPVT